MKNSFIYSALLITAILISINSGLTFAQIADNNLKLRLNNNIRTSNLKTEVQSKDSLTTPESYTPGSGFKIVETDKGSASFGVFSYLRYLNQKGLDTSYTDSFGKTRIIKERQDLQLNKVNIKFFGWLMDPKFRYYFFVWTSNTSLGQVSQVVIGGNLQYNINKYINVGAGIASLPGVFSTIGNFPNWLPVDNRLIADEFFRPSYTTGIWANGNISDKLKYQFMAGNNLSQFGVDAGQLTGGLRTFSGVLNWFPTTGEFGSFNSFGDFDDHKKPATLLAGHFTYSQENKESQPNSDQFENVQLRLSDGSIIFTPDLFKPGIIINEAVYKMTCADLGFKYKGFAFVGEYYWRWLSNFTGYGIDTLGFMDITDNGFQVLGSFMIIKQRLQAFATFSQVYGKYGNPHDARYGFNFFPWKTQAYKFNIEYMTISRSPVGALSLPYPVGGNGGIFNMDFMINF